MRIPLVLILCAITNLPWAMAQTARVGKLEYGGNGCPAGTATVTTRGEETNIQFENYRVQVGAETGRTLDRRTCQIAIPIQVPAGFSASLSKIDFLGRNDLPEGATSRISIELFAAGGSGPVLSKTFQGKLAEDFSISLDPSPGSQIWTPCGEDSILRLNTSIFLTGPASEQSTSGLKSASGFRVTLRRCDLRRSH